MPLAPSWLGMISGGPTGATGPTGPAGPSPSGTGFVTVSSGVPSAVPAGDGLNIGSTVVVQAADSSITIGPTGLSVQTQLNATLASANAYSQSLAYNISSKEPAHAATATALPANTATPTVMTASANGALPLIDGESLLVGERVLVKNEGTTSKNGIYQVTSLGDALNPWVLTRTADADTAAELCGAQVPVDTGTQQGTVWIFSANQNTFVLGTTAVIWTQITVPVATNTVAGTIILAGDLAGSYSTPTVAKINGSTVPAGGALTTGNVLQVSGAGALSYAALNLAGGANYVTGTLPAANQASQSMAGDVTGTTAASVVAQLQGRAVSNTAPSLNQVLTWNGSAWAPAATAAAGVTAVTAASPLTSTGGTTPQIALANGTTAGNTINWNGSAWQSSALNLAGGAGYVTGVLPLANHAAPATANAFPYMATSGVWNATGLSGTNQLIGFNGSTPAVVSIGSGLSLSSGTLSASGGGGSAVAPDANDIYYWKCNDAAGALVNNVTSIAGTSTPAGVTVVNLLAFAVSGGAYGTGAGQLGTKRLFKSATALTLWNNSPNESGYVGAKASTLNSTYLTGAITVECVVALSTYGTNNGENTILRIFNTAESRGYRLYVSTPSYPYTTAPFLRCDMINNNGTTTLSCQLSPGSVAFGRPVHLAFTWNGASEERLFVDGEMVTRSGTLQSLASQTITNFTLGSSWTGVTPPPSPTGLTGDIAEVRISNIARTAAELQARAAAVWTL